MEVLNTLASIATLYGLVPQLYRSVRKRFKRRKQQREARQEPVRVRESTSHTHRIEYLLREQVRLERSRQLAEQLKAMS